MDGSLDSDQQRMLYFPFDTASDTLAMPTNATKLAKEMLEIKPSPHLNPLTYCVSNRDVPLMQRQVKQFNLLKKALGSGKVPNLAQKQRLLKIDQEVTNSTITKLAKKTISKPPKTYQKTDLVKRAVKEIKMNPKCSEEDLAAVKIDTGKPKIDEKDNLNQ